jgi:hypothetical protein
MTEKQLQSRQSKVREAEAKLHQAQAHRDAAIIQAVNEGRTQTWVANVIGVTKARIGRIIHTRAGD